MANSLQQLCFCSWHLRMPWDRENGMTDSTVSMVKLQENPHQQPGGMRASTINNLARHTAGSKPYTVISNI